MRLGPADGARPGLSIQLEPSYVPPSWPSSSSSPQMQVHLDIEVDDLDAAIAHAESLGLARRSGNHRRGSG